MAGVKGRSGGHNRKTTAELKASGGYRPDRHGARADAAVKASRIDPPSYLGAEGKSLWSRVISTLPDTCVTEIDRNALGIFCSLADSYKLLRKQFAADPIDKEIRISFLAVIDRMDKLGRQFGWTPQSRAGLTTPAKDDEPESGFAQLLERMSGRN